MKKILGWIDALFDRFSCFIGAVVFLQIPLFIHQYTLILKGHLDELSFHIRLIREAAARSDKTLDQYIQKFLKSGDMDFVSQGQIMQTLNARLHEMTNSYNALQEASLWSKPFVFIYHWQSEIGRVAWDLFQPGLAFTLEGTVYSLFGVVLGYSLYRSISRIFR